MAAAEEGKTNVVNPLHLSRSPAESRDRERLGLDTSLKLLDRAENQLSCGWLLCELGDRIPCSTSESLSSDGRSRELFNEVDASAPKSSSLSSRYGS